MVDWEYPLAALAVLIKRRHEGRSIRDYPLRLSCTYRLEDLKG